MYKNSKYAIGHYLPRYQYLNIPGVTENCFPLFSRFKLTVPFGEASLLPITAAPCSALNWSDTTKVRRLRCLVPGVQL